jgi:23S rRNA pseudouridine2605 synthase
MPRDSDDNNRRPPGRGSFSGKGGGRTGKPPVRGGRPDRPSRARPDGKGFGAKASGERKFGDKPAREGRPYAAKGAGFRKDADRPRSPRRDDDKRPTGAAGRFAGKPSDRSAGRDRTDTKPWQKRDDRPHRAAEGDRGPRKFDRPKFDRPKFDRPREDRGAGGERPRPPRDTGEAATRRPFAKGSSDKPWEKREARPARAAQGDRGPRKFDRPREDRGGERGRDERPRTPRPEGQRFEKRSFGERKPFEKKPFDRGSSDKPWQKREDRPSRAASGDRGPRKFDRPGSDRDRSDRPKFDRPKFDRPKFDRPREDRPRPPRSEERGGWQDHERSDAPRPRENRPAIERAPFGGRGEYRARKPEFTRGGKRDDRGAFSKPRRERDVAEASKPKKIGERIAKVVARAGLCSRRDAEQWIADGRVAVNGRVVTSPALDIIARDVVTIDGERIPERERTRLFLYHKPRGLVTTHSDPEQRATVFDNLPEDLPRLISIGRLDYNTEGLLLLTNDGGLARALELPDTGWLRRYRVRAHGDITQPQLDALRKGIEVDGVKYGPIDASLDREQGANSWITFAIREGKNREVRNVLGALGLEVNRLIRVSYGPFQLGELAEGAVEEIKTRVLRDQLGDKIVEQSGADFALPAREGDGAEPAKARSRPPREERPHRAGLIKDRKGRRILVERSGGEAKEQSGDEGDSRPPRRPVRPYRGKSERPEKN